MSAMTCIGCGASAVILGPNDLCYGCDLVNALPPPVVRAPIVHGARECPHGVPEDTCDFCIEDRAAECGFGLVP